MNKTTRDIDAPLENLKDDSLGRKRYAEEVAAIIRGWKSDHSLVLAIYGEWGSGKTSLKNFIIEILHRTSETDRPTIIEFNPWEWDGPQQITQAFFARLTEEIGASATAGQEVSKRLGRYAAYLTIGASIAESAGSILPFFIPGTGPLGSIVAAALRDAGKQASVGSSATPKEKKFSELRKDVVESLRKVCQPILVCVDDVDRLTSSETATLFQLLKSNADFPNVVYLLLCDQKVVGHNLGRVVEGRGDDYLEKIVQLGLPLPRAYPEQIRASLITGLTGIFEKKKVESSFDRHRLRNLLDQHAGVYFRTMRNVNRFLAIFEAVLPAVINDVEPEVDLVDFVGMEILRVFEAEFHDALFRSRARLLGLEGVLSKDAEFVKSLQGNKTDPWPALDIFRELFPRFGPQRTLKRRPRGVAHRRSFDRYFILAVPTDQYSSAEEEVVLQDRSDQHRLLEALREALRRGRLQYLIELLDGAAPLSDASDVAGYIAGIIDFTDTLHISDGSDEVDSFRQQLSRLVFKCIGSFTGRMRGRVFLDGVRASQGIWLPTAFADHFFTKEKELLTKRESQQLRKIVLERIRGAGTALRRLPGLGEILLWWAKNGGRRASTQLVSEMVKNSDDLLHLLNVFSQLGLANTGKARKRLEGYHAFARQLGAFVDLKRTLRHLDTLDDAHLTWRERQMIRAFRDDAKRVIESEAESAKTTTTADYDETATDGRAESPPEDKDN